MDRLTRYAKETAMAVLLAAGLLGALITDAGASPEEPAATAEPGKAKPSGRRYGIRSGVSGFTDKEAAMEVARVKETTPEAEREAALAALFRRHKSEGRRIFFNRDYVVRIVEKTDSGYYGVVALNPEGLKSASFWVSKTVLEDADSLFGSEIVTGKMIFRGKEGTSVDRKPVLTAQDLVDGLYEHSISEDAAYKCVFMPEAQEPANVEFTQDGYAIYRTYNSHFFAVGQNRYSNPLGAGPVGYAGRRSFSNPKGTTMEIPLLDLQ